MNNKEQIVKVGQVWEYCGEVVVRLGKLRVNAFLR